MLLTVNERKHYEGHEIRHVEPGDRREDSRKKIYWKKLKLMVLKPGSVRIFSHIF